MTSDPKPLDHLANISVCGCGSCKKAVEDALAEFQALSGGNCIHWYMTRVMLNAIIASLIAQDPRVESAVRVRIIDRQTLLQPNFVSEATLNYLAEQIEAIDAANMLKAEGGKPN